MFTISEENSSDRPIAVGRHRPGWFSWRTPSLPGKKESNTPPTPSPSAPSGRTFVRSSRTISFPARNREGRRPRRPVCREWTFASCRDLVAGNGVPAVPCAPALRPNRATTGGCPYGCRPIEIAWHGHLARAIVRSGFDRLSTTGVHVGRAFGRRRSSRQTWSSGTMTSRRDIGRDGVLAVPCVPASRPNGATTGGCPYDWWRGLTASGACVGTDLMGGDRGD